MNRIMQNPRTTIGLATLWIATVAILVIQLAGGSPSAKAAQVAVATPAAGAAPAAATSGPTLAQQKVQTTKYVNDFLAQMAKQGMPPTVEDQCLWSRRQMEAEHDAATTDADRAAALQGHLKRMRDLEASCKQTYQLGRLSYLSLMTVTYHRIEAEQLAADGG
jgi:hypothetical protein